jgi:hypothetical protein
MSSEVFRFLLQSTSTRRPIGKFGALILPMLLPRDLGNLGNPKTL